MRYLPEKTRVNPCIHRVPVRESPAYFRKVTEPKSRAFRIDEIERIVAIDFDGAGGAGQGCWSNASIGVDHAGS